MKILYATLKAGSGSDVYYARLNESMNKLEIESKIINYHNNLGIFPIILSSKDYGYYDIIHSTAGSGFVFKKKSKPLILTVLHVISDPWKQKYLSPAQKIYYSIVFLQTKKSLRSADFVITISKSTEDVVRKLFGITNLQTIHCGIDSERFKPLQINHDPYPKKMKLLFVGNLTTRKGVDLLPKIMRRLDERFLLLYTTGLRTKKKIFTDNKMIPLGMLSLSEIVEIYNLCDMLIMPSRLEGFGYSALESMACGKPVIATNCSSIPELVDNGKGGFLCEMDNVDNFAEKIKVLADDKNLREQMGKYNREKVLREFNLLKMGKEYEKIYRKFC